MATIPNIPPGLQAKGYTLEGNTLKRHYRPDPMETLRVEIGNATVTAEFLPDVKLIAWEECNFGIKMPMLPGAKCEWEGDTLTYGNNTYLCKFYDKTTEGIDGYEFEVDFLRKPPNNTWTFDLVMDDVVAHYQPPLTPEESGVDENGNPLFIRPDNVVGSYAIYKASPYANRTGEKLYRVGKVVHLYRPYIQDALGNGVWCDMVLDSVGKTLTVTIPLAFFNTAPLPWKLDPEMGYHTAGASSVSLENMVSCMNHNGTATITATENGTVNGFQIYNNPSSTGHHYSGALYSDGTTLNLVKGGDEMTPAGTGAAWRSVTFTTNGWPSIVNSTTYNPAAWAWSGTGTDYILYDTTGSNNQATRTAYTFGSPMAAWSSTVTRGTSAYIFSIYFTYTASGGGAATNPGWAGGGCW